MCALFQQLGVAEGYRAQFLRREVRVAEHPLEAVHVDVRDVAHHQDGLLHLAGVADKVLHLAEPVIELLSLLVDLDGFLKIFHHIRGRRRCLHDVFRGIDDALCEIGRVCHDPLRLCREAEEEAAHTQH